MKILILKKHVSIPKIIDLVVKINNQTNSQMTNSTTITGHK